MSLKTYGLETSYRHLEYAFDQLIFSLLSTASLLQRRPSVSLGAVGPSGIDALLATPLADSESFGAVATHKSAATMREVPRLLGFKRYWFEPGRAQAAEADAFYMWGIRTSIYRARLRWLAKHYQRPLFIVEDGLLLRSLGLGVGDNPEHTLSVTLDAKTAYYDITRPSTLEDCLNSAVEPTERQRQRATVAMAEIRLHRLSKYNHAPDRTSRYGPSGGKRVLLIDQRRLDASVRFGNASERSFNTMIRYAIRERPDHQLLLKRHPDAITGGEGSYFSNRRLKRLPIPWNRTTLIDEDVNPHTLFDQVDEVFVVTSGFGYEALMAGLPVHCFGAPFYSGWGLTTDHVAVPRRNRKRELIDLFHFANIELARYFAPDLSGQVTLENAIDRFADMTRFRKA